MANKDLYGILGVNKNATEEEIKNAKTMICLERQTAISVEEGQVCRLKT